MPAKFPRNPCRNPILYISQNDCREFQELGRPPASQLVSLETLEQSTVAEMVVGSIRPVG